MRDRMRRWPPDSSGTVCAEAPGARAARGFTLLEVLVALLVLALALLALMRTAAVEVDRFAALRQRTLAAWLAQDVLAETRLGSRLPANGKSDGTRRFGNSDWRWSMNVQATAVPTIRRIDVRVFAEADRDAAL